VTYEPLFVSIDPAASAHPPFVPPIQWKILLLLLVLLLFLPIVIMDSRGMQGTSTLLPNDHIYGTE
jgi:hypothetical protein